MRDGVLLGGGCFSSPVVIKGEDVFKVCVGAFGVPGLGVKTGGGNFHTYILNPDFPEILRFLIREGVRFSPWKKIELKFSLWLNRWRIPKPHARAMEDAIGEIK